MFKISWSSSRWPSKIIWPSWIGSEPGVWQGCDEGLNSVRQQIAYTTVIKVSSADGTCWRCCFCSIERQCILVAIDCVVRQQNISSKDPCSYVCQAEYVTATLSESHILFRSWSVLMDMTFLPVGYSQLWCFAPTWCPQLWNAVTQTTYRGPLTTIRWVPRNRQQEIALWLWCVRKHKYVQSLNTSGTK